MKKQGGIIDVLLFIILLASVVALAWFGYYIYLNLPGEAEFGDIDFESNGITNGEVKVMPMNESDNKSLESSQFHPNMKFNHNRISYNIDYDCSEEQRKRMIDAFGILSQEVGIISFYPKSENFDISISCSEENQELEGNPDYFIAGEGGAKEVVQTGRYYVITNGVISLYQMSKRSIQCDWPNVELHELIHVFGFDHNDNINSLMYPYLESCNQQLDDNIVEELQRLYAEKNIPDLYFEKVKVVKKGIYLDFNFTVRNSGTIDANFVKFSVLDEGEVVETRDLVDVIEYGAGISLEIANFKLLNRNSKSVKFVLDRKNTITEIDEENNVAEISFGE